MPVMRHSTIEAQTDYVWPLNAVSSFEVFLQ